MSHLVRATASAVLVGGLSFSLLPATAVTAEPTSAAVTVQAATKKSAVGYARLDAVSQVMLPTTAFSVTGVLGRTPARAVVLQAVSGSMTRTVATAQSRNDGTFTFTGVRLPSTSNLRVVSPKAVVRVDNGTKARQRHRKAVRELRADQAKLDRLLKKRQTRAVKAQVRAQRGVVAGATRKAAFHESKLTRLVTIPRAESKPIRVDVVARQSVRAASLPPVNQAGATAGAPASGHTVSAGFVPARPGRAVTLERLVGTQWQTTARGVQDRSGHGVFNVAQAGTYRVVTAATSEAAALTSGAVETRDLSLSFEDTFSSTRLDSRKWVVQNRPVGTGSRSCASTDGSSHSVNGKVLKLGVSKNPKRKGTCTYVDKDGVKHKLPWMRNTQLATEGKFDFRYGFAAARIRVQDAVGMHSAFWSNPNQAMTRNRPDLGVEVDVMEYFGSQPRYENGVAAFVHHMDGRGTVHKIGDEFASTTRMKSTARFHQNFHVFSVEWTPTSYVFRVDGREFHRVTGKVSKVDQHLLLSNLTSSYELVDLTKFGATADVDWVRVWQ